MATQVATAPIAIEEMELPTGDAQKLEQHAAQLRDRKEQLGISLKDLDRRLQEVESTLGYATAPGDVAAALNRKSSAEQQRAWALERLKRVDKRLDETDQLRAKFLAQVRVDEARRECASLQSEYDQQIVLAHSLLEQAAAALKKAGAARHSIAEVTQGNAWITEQHGITLQITVPPHVEDAVEWNARVSGDFEPSGALLQWLSLND